MRRNIGLWSNVLDISIRFNFLNRLFLVHKWHSKPSFDSEDAFGSHDDISSYSFWAGFNLLSPFLSFLDILLLMSGFSSPDIPSVTLGTLVAEVAR